MRLSKPVLSPTPEGLPPLSHPRKPALLLPPDSCDSHVHIYGPFAEFPLPEDRSFTPHEAPERALRALHDHLGIDRAVIVQSQGHAYDHRPLLSALAAGAGRYRGVALLRPADSDATITALDAGGVCGARFSFMSHLGASPAAETVQTIAARVHPFGWHIAIHVAGSGILAAELLIRSLPTPVVIDHMGRFDVTEGGAGPAMTALLRLLDTGRVWVKLSGADRLSQTGPPYLDVVPIGRRIANHAPERVLWGSDWPHVNLHGPMPDDGELVDLIGAFAPTPAARQLLLVDNPAKFFGFPIC